MNQLTLCVLFGGVSPEHEVSLRSAETVLSHLDRTRYRILPVGITRDGHWMLYGSDQYDALPSGRWEQCPANRPAILSPARGQGLLIEGEDGYYAEPVGCVIPVLHGANGEDGSIQGLMQLAGIPCVGPGVAASAAALDKTMTKLVADKAGVRQADWQLVTAAELKKRPEEVLARLDAVVAYPCFVKPAGTGSSVGVTKVPHREALLPALELAARYDSKILVEEFIRGREIEVAVLGNETPAASICGEIDSGAEFYDYDAKYLTDTSTAYIPARISDAAAEQVRDTAVKIYRALGCRGLSRVDFFVTPEEEVVFNEINTIPGFTSISMYPKLFEASGLPISALLDQLIGYALDAHK